MNTDKPWDPIELIREIGTALSRGEIIENGETGRAQILLEFPSLADALEAKDCLEMLAAMIESDRRSQQPR